MAGDAELRARLTLDQNVDEAVRLASQSLTKMSSDVEKAQAKIAAIIVKGDPLKAIEAQARKEIAAVEKAAAVGGKAAEMAERAKEEILRRASEKRLKLIEKEQEDAKRLVEEQRKVEEKAAAEKAAADRRAADEARRLAEEQAAAARRAAEEERRAAQEAADARAAAQRRVTEILERGEPLRALKRKTREEYDAIRDLERQKLITTQQGEEARAKVLADYSDRRRRIRNGEQDDHIKAANATRDAVGRLEQPINDIRGMMDSLGVATNSAMGHVAQMGADVAAAFSSAGPVGLAIAAAVGLVGSLAFAWRESRDAAYQAKKAMAEEFKSANDAVAAQIQAVRDDTLRRNLRLQGVSDEQIQADEIKGAAQLRVASQQESVNALKRQLDGINAQLAKLDERVKANPKLELSADYVRLGTQAGDTNDKLRIAEQELADASAHARTAEVAAEELLAVARKEKAKQDAERIKKGLQKELSSLSSGDKFGAQFRAERDAETARAAEPDRLMAEGLAEAQKKTRDLAVAAKVGIEQAMKDVNPFAALGMELRRETERIDEQIKYLAGVAADPEVREQALVAIEAFEQQKLALQDRYLQKTNELEVQRINEATRPRKKESSNKDGEAKDTEWVNAGMNAGASFAYGLKSYMDSRDPMDLFKGLLSAASGVLAVLVGGPAGAAISGAGGLIGGLFRNGGTPYAFDLPQGRNGLAVLPGVNYDAKPAWLHKNEVVMPEEVVNDTFGGLPNAARVAAGGPPPGRAAPLGGDTFVIKSFDSQDALGGIRRALGPAAEFARDVRQSARFFEATAPRALRYA